jgi:melibiose permease/lactose/raffinose/galactose permease
MVTIGIAGLILFSGQGFIQVLVLVMLADTIEYGQWKLGTRNESIIFAINPFVTKLATSVQVFVVSLTLAASGLNEYVINPLTEARRTNPNMTTEQARQMIAANVNPEMLLNLRIAMIIMPLVLIVISYLIYRWKYRIDAKMYAQITHDLEARIQAEEM